MPTKPYYFIQKSSIIPSPISKRSAKEANFYLFAKSIHFVPMFSTSRNHLTICISSFSLFLYQNMLSVYQIYRIIALSFWVHLQKQVMLFFSSCILHEKITSKFQMTINLVHHSKVVVYRRSVKAGDDAMMGIFRIHQR
jgi:cytochrome c biogenesis protein CcdA